VPAVFLAAELPLALLACAVRTLGRALQQHWRWKADANETGIDQNQEKNLSAVLVIFLLVIVAVEPVGMVVIGLDTLRAIEPH
jgi:Na+-transporting methylmalonyl-CoA/oxaloacetate decarboxylase gamma subunit